MEGITILDGGMGQELVRRSKTPLTPLWSGRIMHESPDLVRQVHVDFIRAGADIITVNAYSCTPERLARDGMEHLFESLQLTACHLAKTAVDECGQPVRIAGCLPPLVQSYQAELIPDDDILRRNWGRVVAQQAPHVDLFIAETLTTRREARYATEAATASGLPVWVAFTVADRDGLTLRSGEPLALAAEEAASAGASALLVNCSWPEAVPAALPVLAATGLPVGAYANGFTGISALSTSRTVEVLKTRDDIGPIAYADHAMVWMNAGATIVGGCCEIGPRHIEVLRNRVTVEQSV